MTENNTTDRVAIVTGGSSGIGREAATRLGQRRLRGGDRVRREPGRRRGGRQGGRAGRRPGDRRPGRRRRRDRGGGPVRPDRAGVRRCRRGRERGRHHAAGAAGRPRSRRSSTASSGPTCAAPSWSTSRRYGGCAAAARSSTSPAPLTKLARPNYSAYAATKGGVEAITLILARELRGRDVTVNAVAPGPTATALFFDGKSQELIDRIAAEPPLERLGQPSDIAEIIAFLAGPARWINGQVIYANGGSAA